MPAKEKSDLLRSFLGSLPESIANRLARAIEVDRLNNGSVLPHDLILEGLRPALRKAQPKERTANPIRAFCRPFEDLLIDETPREKLKGRIPRDSVTPVWNWLAQTLMPNELNAYSIAVKMAVLGGKTDELRTKTADFWRMASQAIQTKLNNESGRKAARLALGGNAVIDDACEMAVMMSVGAEVCELQDRLPAEIPAMNDDILHAFRDVYDRVVAAVPDAAAYLPLVVMSRLDHPWEALRLPLTITRTTQETLLAATDMGLVGEILFGIIEQHGAAIRAARPNQFNANDLIGNLEGFTTLTSGMVKEVELRRDGAWGQRIIKDRAAVAEVMDGFMERASKEIMAALPTQKTGSYSGGPRVPDFSKPADPERSDRALSYARLIAGCRRLAAAASFAASLKKADDEIGTELETYNDGLVREMRAAAGEARLHGEQYFAVATELTATLFSAEEGEFLRRRGHAATSVAA
ncbi:MAG TPA: hypothetical protein VLV55_13130 [Rhizomicrobium sp.]|nr:hypothetical protein [Rhizomicrobium sp.]